MYIYIISIIISIISTTELNWVSTCFGAEMTFALRSLGARSSGRKEPSGRRHRLQTAMASLPQNESMGKILGDVCCKLLSSALLRSDGESVFMLTAESRHVRFLCETFCT